MLDQFNHLRNNNGYIVLDSFEKYKIDKQTYGSRVDKTWFQCYDDNFLFKASQGYLEEIKEIINEELAKQLSIKNAEYDLATYQGKKGIITRDFIKNKNFQPMLCLLCECNQVQNNIYNYYNAFNHQNIDYDILIDNLKHLFHSHLLDIFTCQHDRNFKNIGTIGSIISPRYDSAGSFLTIAKYEKIVRFMESKEKAKLISRYNGNRTKLRILPGDISQNSIDELLQARFDPQIQVPELLKVEINNLDDFINKIKELDWNLIFYLFKEYNISLPLIYQDFFQTVFQYKIDEYDFKRSLKK